MSMETLVIYLWYVISAYGLVGVAVATFIHLRALHLLDDSANGGTIGFRILITPGLVALWPLLLRKAQRQKRGGDIHGNPDTPLSARQLRMEQSILIKLLAVIIPILVGAALLTRPDRPTEKITLPGITQTEKSISSAEFP